MSISLINRLDINIAIVGAVSVGKSTLTNLLFVDHYSDMKIKRTTALPQVYHEINDNTGKKSATIREENRIRNKEIMDKTLKDNKLDYSEIREIEYLVPKLYDFINLKKDVFLTIYDLPGLNDAHTKEVYFKYLRENFYKFDIIICVFDINSGINTSDEIDILESVINGIKFNKEKYNTNTKLMVLLNKCDDMEKNDIGHLVPSNDELIEMIDQVEELIKKKITTLNFDVEYSILPISCEDAYIYRMLKRNHKAELDPKHLTRFGTNEYGKKWVALCKNKKNMNDISELIKNTDFDERLYFSGFKQFAENFGKYLDDDGQYNCLLNHINYEMSLMVVSNNHNIGKELENFFGCKQKLKKLNKIFHKKNYNSFETSLKSFTGKYKSIIVDNQSIPTSPESHEVISTIKNNIALFKTYFPENKNWIDDMDESINYKMNQYYLKCINDKNISLDILLDFFSKLHKNGYPNLEDVIINVITSLRTYTNAFPLATTQRYEYAAFITNLNNEYKLDEKKYIEAIFNLVLDYYQTEYVSNVICNHSACIYQSSNFYEMVNVNKYWKSIQIKTDNNYWELIELIKNNFTNPKSINTGFLINYKLSGVRDLCDIYKGIRNVYCDLSMESLIYDTLKKIYPCDVCEYDDLIGLVNDSTHIDEDFKSCDSENEYENDNTTISEDIKPVISVANKAKIKVVKSATNKKPSWRS